MTRIVNSSNAFNLHPAPSLLSDSQLRLDALNASFSQQASNSVNLLAMAAGGFAAQGARTASLAVLRTLPGFLRSPFVSVFSLGTQVAAFRGVTHAFSNTGESYLSAQGFAREMINFGCLNGAGYLLQGGNPVATHVIQNLAMIAGEEVGAGLHLTERSHGTFAERFANASVLNLALGTGHFFSGVATGHRLSIVERSLEQSSRVLARETSRGEEGLLSMASREGERYIHPAQALIDRIVAATGVSAAEVQETLDATVNGRMTPEKLAIFMGWLDLVQNGRRQAEGSRETNPAQNLIERIVAATGVPIAEVQETLDATVNGRMTEEKLATLKRWLELVQLSSIGSMPARATEWS